MNDNGLMLATLLVLRRCEEYFDRHADADQETDDPYPRGNEEMDLLQGVREAIANVERAARLTRTGNETMNPEEA